MNDRSSPGITQQTSRSEVVQGSTEPVPYLVRALECEALAAGSTRVALSEVNEVCIGRGERRVERTREGKQARIRLSIPDRKASLDHARLLRVDAEWVIEDRGSTNGTAVFGSRITRTALADGDVIEIGSTLFLYREAPGSGRPLTDKELLPGGKDELATLSPALEEGVGRIRRIAASQLSVLLLGETGSGKEVVARSIHVGSGRPGAFVPVNCGAIPGPLMEAQLFGHVKGAFTGAVRDEIGFVRSAHFGTLFLDEIADLPPSSQAALLRVLQSGDVTPVGSAKSIHADVRVLAATHKNLETLMDQGIFRRDLYARLAGFAHPLLPLRDRPEDLGWLVGTLLARHAAKVAPIQLKLDAARALFAYPFPMNVRELEQCLASALVLADGEPIALLHLPDALRKLHSQPLRPSRAPASPEPESAEDRAVRDCLLEALRETGGNVSETARRLGKARQQVQRWLRRFAIDPSRFQ